MKEGQETQGPLDGAPLEKSGERRPPASDLGAIGAAFAQPRERINVVESVRRHHRPKQETGDQETPAPKAE